MARVLPNTKNIQTSCFVMPVVDELRLDENLRVKGNFVQYNDLTTNQKVTFNFNKVYADQQDFAKASFNSSISPLVKQSIEGESTMVLFAGVHNQQQQRNRETSLSTATQTSHHSLSTHSIVQSLVSQSAGQLINSVISNDGQHRKLGSVTFSWYTVDCSTGEGGEILSDILKTASTMGTGNTAPASSESPLMLRELGKGRGIIIPGLWEVEVASAADVESVIAHVQKMIPSANYNSLTGANSHYHTVMQLSVTNHKNKGASVASPSRNSTLVSDPPGVGRLSFVLLANITPSFQQQPVLALSPWVESLHHIVSWLESRRVSPPFHKSRLLLILKDVLCGRQSASLVLFAQQAKEHHELNFEWFRLVARMSKDHTSDAVAAHKSTTDSNNTSNNTNNAATNNLNSSQAVTINLHNNIHSSTASAIKTIKSSTVGTPGARKSLASVAALHATNNHLSSLAQNGSSEMTFLDGVTNNARQAGTPSNVKRSSSANDVANSHLLGQSSFNLNNNTHGMQTPGSKHTARAPQYPPSQHQQLQQQKHTHDDNGSTVADSEYVDDFSNRETEAALSLALEASRNEAAALKIAYNYANEKYGETKTAYDTLLEQLKEEGAMLTKRDRDRYRAALKDLKDYEIYKEVMEAAMVKLQGELELYAKENTELRDHRLHEEKVGKKQKSFSEKYAKDLCATRKKLVDTEMQLTEALKQNKSLSRERDAAVATLSQVKSVGSMREGQVKATAELRQTELDDLRKKLTAAEGLSKSLRQEKDALLAESAKKEETLRRQQRKQMENMMTLQEENDRLQQAVRELNYSSGPQSPLPPPPLSKPTITSNTSTSNSNRVSPTNATRTSGSLITQLPTSTVQAAMIGVSTSGSNLSDLDTDAPQGPGSYEEEEEGETSNANNSD